jgi:hypothetical protein
MSVIGDVLKELFSMFVGDARLTLAVLILVAVVALSLHALPSANPTLSGFALLGGCITIIITITTMHANRVKKPR